MAVNFDFNKARSIFRTEINGSTRFLITTLCAAAMWGGAAWFFGLAESASSALILQETRYHELSRAVAEYRALTSSSSASKANSVDAMTAFTQVSAQIGLGSRVSRVVPTPDGKRCSVEVGRLYAEELVDMVRELAARGIRVISAEVRALPASQERLFTLSAVVGIDA
ncbi:MAG: hypothetical protein LBD04_04555 [Synergistaceae bacterium]|jgi:hypothetical protein|nr:hypothetical protein [Synergistaceae bacterium]